MPAIIKRGNSICSRLSVLNPRYADEISNMGIAAQCIAQVIDTPIPQLSSEVLFVSVLFIRNVMNIDSFMQHCCINENNKSTTVSYTLRTRGYKQESLAFLASKREP